MAGRQKRQKTRVIDSRGEIRCPECHDAGEVEWIRRRRKCLACDTRVTTYETRVGERRLVHDCQRKLLDQLESVIRHHRSEVQRHLADMHSLVDEIAATENVASRQMLHAAYCNHVREILGLDVALRDAETHWKSLIL